MNKNTIRLLYMLCQRSFLAVTSLLSLFSSGSFARFALPSVDAAAFAWTLPDVFLWSSSAYGCGGGGATYTPRCPVRARQQLSSGARRALNCYQ
jgi:hypothetical protein